MSTCATRVPVVSRPWSVGSSSLTVSENSSESKRAVSSGLRSSAAVAT